MWSVLRSAVYPVQWIGLVMICCGMAVKKMEMLRVCMRNAESNDCKYGNSNTDWWS
jgi:hypothetical protein